MTTNGDCRRCHASLLPPVSGACGDEYSGDVEEVKSTCIHAENSVDYEGMLQPVGSIVGARLRQIRQAMHMSQPEMAMLTEVSQAWVSMLECGRTDPQIGTLEKYTQYLKVPLCILLGTSEEFERFIQRQVSK
jgi:DNA-binding XRE family transcriptional regulator